MRQFRVHRRKRANLVKTRCSPRAELLVYAPWNFPATKQSESRFEMVSSASEEAQCLS